jgi:ribosomal protein S18 acetylase RimI-like enzyme
MEGPGINVRRATLDDVAGIARVHVQSWQSAYQGQVPEGVIDAQDEAKRAELWLQLLGNSRYVAHVAVRNDTICGFCSLIRSRDPGTSELTGEIATIYVDPAHWRAGAGRALMDASMEVARATGYRAITLWVLESNLAGRRFYEHFGFAPDGEKKQQERADCPLFEVRYRLELPA